MNQGAIASLVTPFGPDGSVNLNELTQLSARMSQAGFDVICFAGGTGEFLSLTSSERDDGLRAVIEGSAGTPVLASALFTDPAETLASAERYAKLGAKALMVMPPYFYAQTQDAIFQHLSLLGRESALPVLLFNSAGRSGRTMSVDTVLRLAHSTRNIVGVKETTESIEDIERLVVGSPDGFSVIQAHEPLVLSSYMVGANGSFGSLCNIIPNTIVRLHSAIEQGELTLAKEVNHQICRVAEAAYSVTIPVGIKFLMNELRIVDSNVRAPLTMGLSVTEKSKLKSVIAEIERIESLVTA